MTQPHDDDKATKTDEPMFTRAQLAREVARQVREGVATKLAEYGDLDELKAKAAQADKNASQLDRIEQQLKASEERAAKAEREGLVRRVADELGISVRLASKLEGGTYAELLADGKDTMEDLGITPKSKTTAGNGNKGDGTDGDGGDATEGSDAGKDDGSGEGDNAPASSRQTAPARNARPRENLRSGAPRTPTEVDETNPLRLVENIPRR